MANIIGGGLESFLRRRAREQAMNALAEAHEKAAAIAAQAQQQADSETAQVRGEFSATIAQTRHRTLTQARLVASQSLVRKQGEIAARLWDRVPEALRRMTSDSRSESLGALLLDAARQLGGGDLLVECNAQDRPLLAAVIEALEPQLQACSVCGAAIGETAVPVLGGVVVRRRGTNRLVDNSWDQRLALVKRTRRDEVFHLLS